MSAAENPSDDELRDFLLGSLPAERVAAVRAWLDADPVRGARLDGLSPRDPLTAAFSDPIVPAPVPAHSVERVAPGALHPTPAELTNPAGTLLQTRPPVVPLTGGAPQKLGEYRVVGEIGRGGMGIVLEVADDTLNRRVAAKVLAQELARRPEATARFLREARAAAAVEHGNVVPILHIGVENGAPYIVMPLLKGEPLDKRLKREGALPVDEVVRIGREITAGLGAAHACGLVHRDMKPANVWLDEGTGRARVLDFGLARRGDGADALTETGAIQGTPAYMAPEQVDGLPTDPRTDLFAVGAILYECATGRRAFEGGTLTAILKAVATHNPAPPAAVNPLVPPELSVLIMRLLAKHAGERPTSAAEVGAGLAGSSPNVPASGAITVTRDDRSVTVTPKSRRGPWLVVGAVTVLVALGLGFGTQSCSSGGTRGEPKIEQSSLRTEPPVVPGPYRGDVDVRLARTKDDPLMRLNVAGALPMRQSDTFRVEAEVDPPAYLYVVWVDPDRDVTPVYPWDAAKGWGSRPTKEQPMGKLALPPSAGTRYRASAAKPGMATMVLFARPTPLDVPDEVVKRWFEALPDLPLPPGGDGAALWFDNYNEVREPRRMRTFEVVGTAESEEPFARWQRLLQKSLGSHASFQSAVSFARTGTR